MKIDEKAIRKASGFRIRRVLPENFENQESIEKVCSERKETQHPKNMATTLFQLQLANQLVALLASSYSFSTTYFSSSTSSSSPSSSSSKPELDDLLDETEMSYLLKWMGMLLETKSGGTEESPNPFRQELYNLFVTIRSDYAEYIRSRRYNQSLWLLSSFRQRNLAPLAKKIRVDVRMFHEGLTMLAHFDDQKKNLIK